MSVSTTGSSNIATLDSKIVADLCAGMFYVDVTPSVYIGAGKDSVLGANVKIVNPHGVTIKEYGSNYEIAPGLSGGMDAIVSFNVPTLAGGYATGQYKVLVELFDGDDSWVIEKTVDVCAPDSANKFRTYKNISAKLMASCTKEKLYIVVDALPNYKGKTVQSQENDFTLDYPTASGVASLDTANGAFAVQLYEGVYKFSGETCATYHMGDNVYVKVKYKLNLEKNVRCLIDECCIYSQLKELNSRLETGCTDKEKQETTEIILDTLRLLETAKLAANCGEDPSEYIEQLEKLLGCSCTCNCAEGAPIVNNEPSTDFRVEGCNVETSEDGLTKVYTIENYEYVVSIAENAGAMTIAAATLDGCVKTQVITLNVPTLYSQLKVLANANNTEADFWSSVINKSLAGAIVDCADDATWDSLTFKQKIQKMWDTMCACCTDCSGGVSDLESSASGNNVVLSWNYTGDDVEYIEIYVDGILSGTVLSPATEYTVIGAADADDHTYTLVSKNAAGKVCDREEIEAAHFGCPEIGSPELPQEVFTETCPFDFTAIMESIPLPEGVTLEVHNANNTHASSLVDHTNLGSGTYWVFMSNGEGCFGAGREFQVVCDSAASCTAPQNLLVEKITGGNRITFQSAAYPPASYTVKRRLSADPDVDGSYTTIGTPVWNSTLNRWAILDATATDNILYVYKAISNCGSSPADPSTTYEFANITCPELTPTVTGPNNIDFSFVPVGGDITKYEVKLYNESGSVLIETKTYLPLFSNPTSGEFEYLTASTTYKIGVVVYIGTYSKVCPLIEETTQDEIEP